MKKAIYKKENEKSLNFDEFLEQHDYGVEPLRMSKMSTGWAKNNMLLDVWNQWLAWEEKQAEKVGPYAEGQGWRHLGEMKRYEQLNNFSCYLTGYCGSMMEFFAKEEKIEEDVRKQNAVDLADDLINSGVL